MQYSLHIMLRLRYEVQMYEFILKLVMLFVNVIGVVIN